MNGSAGRHAAPSGHDRHDPATDPRLMRAAYIADHGLRHLPPVIRNHRYVQVCEVAR